MKTAVAWLASLAALLAGQARGAGLFDRKLELVEDGNRAFSEQHYQQALESYEQAEQQLVDQPRIHFDRGGALYKLGRHKEAREAFLRAIGVDDPELKKRNLFNIGNTFMSEGALPDAAAYFRRALELDPAYDDARFNLELVLRAMEEQKTNQSSRKQDQKDQKEQQDQQQQNQQQKGQQKQDHQRQDQKQQNQQQQSSESQQQQSQQQQQQAEGSEKRQEQQQQQGEQQERQQAEQQQQQPSEQQPMGGKQPQDSSPRKLSRQQIQALLQAMKEGEKPFQLQRFAIPEFRQRKLDKDW